MTITIKSLREHASLFRPDDPAHISLLAHANDLQDAANLRSARERAEAEEDEALVYAGAEALARASDLSFLAGYGFDRMCEEDLRVLVTTVALAAKAELTRRNRLKPILIPGGNESR